MRGIVSSQNVYFQNILSVERVNVPQLLHSTVLVECRGGGGGGAIYKYDYFGSSWPEKVEHRIAKEREQFSKAWGVLKNSLLLFFFLSFFFYAECEDQRGQSRNRMKNKKRIEAKVHIPHRQAGRDRIDMPFHH